MTNLYSLDQSKITEYLQNYDPIRQYFCILPHNDTSRLLFVPQEYLIHFANFLLPCNIPTQIVESLAAFKHLVFSLLDDKDTSYYTALSKQSCSYNEFHFISAKVISFMVKPEQNVEQKSIERRRSPSRTSQSVMLNLRTLRDITQRLDCFGYGML